MTKVDELNMTAYYRLSIYKMTYNVNARSKYLNYMYALSCVLFKKYTDFDILLFFFFFFCDVFSLDTPVINRVIFFVKSEKSKRLFTLFGAFQIFKVIPCHSVSFRIPHSVINGGPLNN